MLWCSQCSFSSSCRRKVSSVSDESTYCGDKPGDHSTELRNTRELQVYTDNSHFRTNWVEIWWLWRPQHMIHMILKETVHWHATLCTEASEFYMFLYPYIQATCLHTFTLSLHISCFFSPSTLVTQYHSTEREIPPCHKSLCTWREYTNIALW